MWEEVKCGKKLNVGRTKKILEDEIHIFSHLDIVAVTFALQAHYPSKASKACVGSSGNKYRQRPPFRQLRSYRCES